MQKQLFTAKLGQLFIAENFRRFFDYENRRGTNLETRFFPDIAKITIDLKDCKGNFKALKKQKSRLSEKQYEQKKSALNKAKDALKEKKEKLLTETLEKISTDITSSGFKIALEEVDLRAKGKAYRIQKSPPMYFAFKQIQHNVQKLYKVKQSNRHTILCQLRGILSNTFPKFIIRTDIQGFFESIPQDRLLKKINQDPLTSLSKKFIKQTLTEYTRLSGSSDGIPRGVGISSYLAELYMRTFDEKIKDHPDIIFYARYVDDIVIVYVPRPTSNPKQYLGDVEKITKELGLTLSPTKTVPFDLTDSKKSQQHKMTYLGYDITFGTGSVEFAFSAAKSAKYELRIKRAFDAYHKKAKTNERKARKLIIKRTRFLTGNTRLLHNKKHALVGIYFSNSMLTQFSDLDNLDRLLAAEIAKIPSANLRATLGKMSFKDGFTQKRFSRFSVVDLTDIVKAWKHAS